MHVQNDSFANLTFQHVPKNRYFLVWKSTFKLFEMITREHNQKQKNWKEAI